MFGFYLSQVVPSLSHSENLTDLYKMTETSKDQHPLSLIYLLLMADRVTRNIVLTELQKDQISTFKPQLGT